MGKIDEAWGVVCDLAGLSDTRIHDCRHSFASRALALGENLPMIGRLLGHSELQATERYAHLERDWVREAACEAASRISGSIAAVVLAGYPQQQGNASPIVAGAVRAKETVPAAFDVTWFCGRRMKTEPPHLAAGVVVAESRVAHSSDCGRKRP